MKILFAILILLIVLIAGCVITDIEIDTGSPRCREITSDGVSDLGVMIDNMCDTLCKQDGYTYKQWKCSSTDTLVCVCNRF